MICRQAGAPACCRLTRSEWSKPATCRRSGLKGMKYPAQCSSLLLEIQLLEIPGQVVRAQDGGAEVTDIGTDGGAGERRDGINHRQLLRQNDLDLVEALLAPGKIQRAHLGVHERVDSGLPLSRGRLLHRESVV